MDITPNQIPTAEQINLEYLLSQSKAGEAVQHATSCGLMLLQVKASLPHGEWLPWLKGQQEAGAIEFSERTSRDYMRVAANRQRAANLEAPSIRAVLEMMAEDKHEGVTEQESQGVDPDFEALANEIDRLKRANAKLRKANKALGEAGTDGDAQARVYAAELERVTADLAKAQAMLAAADKGLTVTPPQVVLKEDPEKDRLLREQAARIEALEKAKAEADHRAKYHATLLEKADCVFHPNWTAIPAQTGHPFHAKLDSRSAATRGGDGVYAGWGSSVNVGLSLRRDSPARARAWA